MTLQWPRHDARRRKPMVKNKTFVRGESITLTSGEHYENCIFDDCEIIGNMDELRDLFFHSCEMKGRAADWFTNYLDRSGSRLMTVDMRTGEITPGPASDRDPSFPRDLRRQ